MSRQSRKQEHLCFALECGLQEADFDDISLVHNCLPGIALDEVTLKTAFAGLQLELPFFINALTGGTAEAEEINRSLAEIAREFKLVMAVGSQMAALEQPSLAKTFKIVRQLNPEGVIISNIGAYASAKTAREAVEMIDANCLQVHLNVPQELAMDSSEGDSSFSGYLQNISEITAALDLPVIVKEIGFGVARREAILLECAGVSAIDIGGYGGTNFIRIENCRNQLPFLRDMYKWGIPTSISLVEVLDGVSRSVDVIASGGVNSSFNIVKALALGAKAVGLAGMPLNILLKEGKESLMKKIRSLCREISSIMLMLGARSIPELQQSPLVIQGKTAEWLIRRGIDIDHYARR